jgi:rhodanese-related sulfurtransferase
MPKISTELKYKLYEQAVQCHENDIEFMNTEFKKHRGREAFVLREDFGGTAAMACDWVKLGPQYTAYGIDLDPEPQKFGQENHYKLLNEEQQKRMTYISGNVLEEYPFKADVIAAFNFSYFIFKNRRDLVDYFTKARRGLKEDGAFFLDIFGGTECQQELVEETEHDDFSYYWDCDSYNPINGHVKYFIHFKTHHDKVKYNQVFTYDWRMWSLAEVTDALKEAGFSEVKTYWEEDDDEGGGNGNFYEAMEAENCESWVTYICALA